MEKTIGFYKGHRAVMGDSIAKMVFQIRCDREKIDLPHTDETHKPLRTVELKAVNIGHVMRQNVAETLTFC